jgi:acyl carrier protein
VDGTIVLPAPGLSAMPPTKMPTIVYEVEEAVMDVRAELLGLLDEVLSLQGRSATFDDNTPLLGSIPELDSMAVVSLMTAMEGRFGIVIDDDDIDGETFSSFGKLRAFIESKVG